MWCANAAGLYGRRFATTGLFDGLTTDDLIAHIQRHGGTCAKRVTKAVHYLIRGGVIEDWHGNVQNTSAKLDKALELNVCVIRQDEYLELCRCSCVQPAES